MSRRESRRSIRVLVTGGAGYIGSHTAKLLARAGHEPVVVDNLTHGHSWAVRWGPLVRADLNDRETLHHVFQEYHVSAVVHFAAFAYVGESMQAPSDYFRNNLVNTLNLLDAMRVSGVSRIVVSSSCAVYGNPQRVPVAEDDPLRPVNPYGESKLMVERALEWYGSAYGLSWVALRYFNAAGADPDGELGEVHDPEPHLIPSAIAAAQGKRPALEVFGTDYETPDGTAIRDYTHVNDLASAHVLALQRLVQGGASGALNLGTGSGHSVRQIVSMVEKVTGKKVPVTDSARRPGDPPVLVADASRARVELGWSPRYSSLEQIIKSAWYWHHTVMPVAGLRQITSRFAPSTRDVAEPVRE